MAGLISRSVHWIEREAGIRFLLRRKVAAAAAILTLALALGANTAVFTVLRTFLLASIGVPDASHVVVVGPLRDMPGRGLVLFSDAYPNYERIRDTKGMFLDVACTSQGTSNWDDRGEPRPLQSTRVTARFFATMGVYPAIGRVFEAREEGPNPAPIVIISHALWSAAFAADPAALGKTMLLDGTPYTIVGVMPPGFSQPAPTDIWLPFDIPATQRTRVTGARSLSVFARLDKTTTQSRADVIAADLTRRALEAEPVDNKDFRYELRPIRTVLLNGAESSVLLVQIGAVVLLVLAVVNLASLLVAWGFDRKREMAVREALGASATRLVRMLLLQSVFVVLVGAVLGFALARASLPWIRGLDINPQLTYFTQRISMDGTIFAVGTIVAVVAGLIAGLLPVWFTRHSDLNDSLRSGSRSVTLSRGALRWQQGIVVLQAALSVVVLAAAALVVVSFRNASHVPLGFEPGKLLVARVQLAASATHPQRVAFMDALEERMRHEPAIAGFGTTSTLPVNDVAAGARFFLEQPDPARPPEPMLLHYRRITNGYLNEMHIPLLRGRKFDVHDDSSGRAVVIVSNAFASRVWPGQDPIGRILYRASTPVAEPIEVVGVAGDVVDAGNRSPPGEAAYVPWARLSAARASIVIEPRGNQAEALAAFRRALKGADPVLAPTGVTTLAKLTKEADALPRLQTLLLLVFAAVAVGITALGSYGVMSQLVANREREYALRLIFGAAPSNLGRSVFLLLARLAFPGILVGLAIILSLSGTLRSFVFGVDPRSVSVLTIVGLTMATITAMAALPSVVRAMRVDVRKSVGAG